MTLDVLWYPHRDDEFSVTTEFTDLVCSINNTLDLKGNSVMISEDPVPCIFTMKKENNTYRITPNPFFSDIIDGKIIEWFDLGIEPSQAPISDGQYYVDIW